MNLTCALLLIFGTLLQESEAPPVIKPSEAANHVNKTVIVEMEVESSSFLRDKEVCFLNSLKDHKAESNFSAVLKKEGIKACQDNQIDDPAKHFLKKKIQVEGKVELFKDKPQIVVSKFEQLKVVGVEPEE